MKNVIIIGAGGFTRELYSYLKDANYEIIGYIDIQENNFFDLKYLGNEDNFDKKLHLKFSVDFIHVLVYNLRDEGRETYDDGKDSDCSD